MTADLLQSGDLSIWGVAALLLAIWFVQLCRHQR